MHLTSTLPRAAVASLLAVTLIVAGCSAAALAATGARTAGAGPAGAIPAGNTDLTLHVMPGDGPSWIYDLIESAHHSLDMTMYELDDLTAERDLAHDAARGTDVRVLLDSDYERSTNQAAYTYLADHRVHVAWAPADVIYHQKTITVDAGYADERSAIMTLNLVSSDYPDTRDLAVVDTDRADVAAIVDTFDADFAHRAITPPDGADLVWSPTNSQATILSVIDGARHTLRVEDEEMDDRTITAALAADARRGVQVEVTMTADPEWDSAFAELRAAGVHVHLYPDQAGVLYIHAKFVLADAGYADGRLELGSENFSVSSLRYNRELGIVTTDKAIVASVAKVFAADYAGAAS